MTHDSECAFCKIATGDWSTTVVFETPDVMAFLDTTPLSEGHLLVIPRQHYSRLCDMPPEDCGAIFSCFPPLGKALMAATGAEAFNVLQNDGPDAGQVVRHVHFHLIPRGPDDGLGFRWNTRSYEPGRAEELGEAVRKYLSETSPPSQA